MSYGPTFLLEIEASETSHASASHPEIQHVQERYNHVFAQPTTLPPQCVQDHHIPLPPHSQPISVRPYRYPFYQKSEIEKI